MNENVIKVLQANKKIYITENEEEEINAFFLRFCFVTQIYRQFSFGVGFLTLT